ncbi:MAG: SYNERG-CTERM sorting domain-containing protein [Synergistaceae bacterium]|jgi:Synergist-CTERM protein sorting domain-containing protein|nr:SYNERG-CTERM sorting domain-containing protein [Synergistaceae bacterium]
MVILIRFQSGVNGYVSTLIFDAAKNSGGSGSSGGCDAGFGAAALIGLPVFLASLRKKRG